ncbi:MAG TPA: tetratricopeptide repeat protein [Gemmatimonas sp.]|nr:tetratricopeptide repeat protein [Gemmatimonas sp.]
MDNNALASRAALEAARAVFARMTATGDLTGSPTGSAQGMPSEANAPGARAAAAWTATEGILRGVTGRNDLVGQALVGEARRLELLTLGDAHVLVALHRWMERQRESPDGALAAAPSDGERTVAREAMLALEHAVAVVQRESARGAAGNAAAGAAGAASFAPASNSPSPYAPAADFSVSGSRRTASGGYDRPEASAPASVADSATADVPPARSPRRAPGSPALLLGGLALLLAVGAGAWYAFGRGGAASYEEGAEAYRRGAVEAASLAFAKAASDDPSDARPLIYLGRIAREQGDMARARRFLDRAVRLAPENAIAQREMASTMLADANPELARRFYVRALELDPTDRLSQGFLACALHRLGRFEDARRFVQRAGSGDWTPCLNTPVAPMLPGTPPGGAMQPPPGSPGSPR